jgi:hypothetical protein
MHGPTGILPRDDLCNKGYLVAVKDVGKTDMPLGGPDRCWMERTLLSRWHHVEDLPPQHGPHLPEA